MQERCPSCDRAWVPGFSECPFCGYLRTMPPTGPAQPVIPAVPLARSVQPNAAPPPAPLFQPGETPAQGLPPVVVPPAPVPQPIAPPQSPAALAPVFNLSSPSMPPVAAVSWTLHWTDSNGVTQCQPITATLTIGRAQGSTVRLDNAYTSRRHALLWVEGGQCYIRDEGSQNGTRVNGQALPAKTPRALQSGDQFSIGETAFQVIAAGAPQAQALSAVPLVPSGGPRPIAPTAQSVTPARPVARESIFTIGGWGALAGIVIGLTMFFAPWLPFYADPTKPGLPNNFDGYEIATSGVESVGTELLSALGYTVSAEVTGSFPPGALFVIPGCMLLALVLVIAGIFIPTGRKPPLLILQLVLDAVALSALILYAVDLRPSTPPIVPSIGYWGTWLAIVLVAVGGLLDLLTLRPGRRPGN